MVTVTNASGSWNPGGSSSGPDGGTSNGGNTNLNGYDGISGIVHTNRTMFLVGVFLDDNAPSGVSPSSLTFAHPENFLTLSPQLRQQFFVGDGLTDTGTEVQQFIVPVGTTRLYLGVADGFSFRGNAGYYGDNTGQVTATIALHPAEGPRFGRIVYLDLNRNGRRDPSERFITTDADGNYAFENLPPNEYVVAEEVPPGWLQTAPSSGRYVVYVAAGETVENLDFGNVEAPAGHQNESPLFTTSAPENATQTVGTLFRYDAWAYDPEGDPLTFDLVNQPNGMVVDPLTGTVVWIPRSDQVAEQRAILRVQDGNGGLALQSIDITVVAQNAAPLVVSKPPGPATVGLPYKYQIRAYDPEGDALTYMLETPIVGMSVNATTGLLAWNPTSVQLPSQLVKVRIDPAAGEDTLHEFTIPVVPTSTNRAPTIDSTPVVKARVARTYLYDLTASDADGDPLVYMLDTDAPGMTIGLDAGGMPSALPGLLRWTPTEQQVGDEFNVRVTVTDGRGGSAEQEFLVHVVSSSENDPPVIVSVPPSLATTAGQEYLYQLVADDADGDRIIWTLIEAPLGMVIDPSTGLLHWTPGVDDVHAHLVTVRATDLVGASGEQTFTLDVHCANQPPAIISRPPTQGVKDELYVYAVRAEDPEGDAITFELGSQFPSGMTIDAQGVIRWTPTMAQAGQSHSVEVLARDAAGAGRQTFSIFVATAPPNKPPVITSLPRTQASAGATYRYQVRATDPEGDAITIMLENAPPGMAVMPGNIIEWTVPLDTPQGTLPPLTVIATDTPGGKARQTYAITIKPNAPPTIEPIADQQTRIGQLFRASVLAQDSADDRLTYEIAGPAGITIDQFGRIFWTVPLDAATDVPMPVTVTVTDLAGQEASEDFNVTVSPDDQGPAVSLRIGTGTSQILSDPVRFNLGTPTFFIVSATDEVGVASITAELVDEGGARTQLALDASGRADRVMTTKGTYNVVATAVDSNGNATQVTRQLLIVDPSDTNPPQVTIISPQPDAIVTYLTDVIGTIDDPENQLFRWDVYVIRADLVDPANLDFNNPNYRKIGSGTTEVTNSKLATFDPTMLTNDGYIIWVVAYDTTGQGWAEPVNVRVEGEAKLGQFRLEFTDLQIPVSGIPITITRTYDTREAAVRGDFGFGWTLGLRDGKIRETAAYGAGGALVGDNTFIPDRTKVYLTGPGGERLGFTYKEQVTGADFFGTVYSRPYFVADPGVYHTLSIDQTTVIRGGFFGELAGGINPDVFTLTTPDGLKYRYNQFSGLQSITDTNGNVLTFKTDGIYLGASRQVTFHRDGQGRITKISYPFTEEDGTAVTHEIRYEYDAKGDLRVFRNQEKLESRYRYLATPAHFLDEMLDHLGNKVVKTEYDENGRIKSVTDANGNPVVYDYDLENNTETVKDANGNPTLLTYDEQGRVAREEQKDPSGETLRTTIYEHADLANPFKETKVTRLVDELGGGTREIVTRYKYDALGNTTEVTDSIGTRSFKYNGRSSVTETKDELGRITTFVYDAANNLRQVTNAVGDSSLIGYDSQGRPTTYQDFRGAITTFVYTGSQTQPREIHNPGDGSVKQFDYNQFGQVTKTTDEAGVETIYAYDASGRLIRERTGEDAPVEYQYAGDLQTKRIVRRSNDDLVTEYGYDAAGRLKFEINPAGNVTGYRYDANGNRTMLGTWGTKADFDQEDMSAGADPHATFQQATFQHKFFYDGANRVDFEVDDYALSLPAASDFERIKLDYEYDDLGNRSKIIDRNARVRTFGYDDRNRLVEELWFENVADTTPDRSFEWVYDAVGNLERATEHDAAIGSPILSQYTYTYDTLGRLATVDNAGTLDMPNVVLSYEYDDNGNRVRVEDNLGVAVVSNYDARNRLDTRTWVNTGVEHAVDEVLVDFDYCNCGQISRISRYTGTTNDPANLVGWSDYGDHDLAGRVRHIQHNVRRSGADVVLANYQYGFDEMGLVNSLDYTNEDSQHDFAVDYLYDELGQLTDADYSDETTTKGVYVDEFYRYDDRGNRTESYLHGAGYETIAGNRLASDGAFNYEYDNEGNLRFKRRIGAESTDFTEYTWDHRNRLIVVEIHEPGKVTRVDYTYDMDGRRIGIETRQGVNEPTIITNVTRMVYDGEQVWADFDTLDVISARFLNGDKIDQILARFQTGTAQSIGTAWYHTDRLGSVHDLIDSDAASIEHMAYASFGRALQNGGGASNDRFAFTGRERSVGENLYFHRSRYYAADEGRFLSQDTSQFGGGDVNFYRYVANSPTNSTDPTGRIAILEYVQTTITLLDSPALAKVGFFHGISYATFSYVGYFFETGSQAGALDLLLRDLGRLLLFNWVVSVADVAGQVAEVPISPLGLVGTYVGGYGVSGKGELVKLLKLHLEQEGQIVLASLLDASSTGENIVDALGPPKLDGNVDESSFGGFINGLRTFLRIL